MSVVVQTEAVGQHTASVSVAFPALLVQAQVAAENQDTAGAVVEVDMLGRVSVAVALVVVRPVAVLLVEELQPLVEVVQSLVRRFSHRLDPLVVTLGRSHS